MSCGAALKLMDNTCLILQVVRDLKDTAAKAMSIDVAKNGESFPVSRPLSVGASRLAFLSQNFLLRRCVAETNRPSRAEGLGGLSLW